MNSLVLRTALGANAFFSGISGIALLAYPSTFAQLLGGIGSGWLVALGGGLVIFALDLLHQVSRTKMMGWRALMASIADFIWVIASVVILIAFRDVLPATGATIIGAVACAVTLFGVTQLLGLHLLYKVTGKQVYRYCLTVSSPLAASRMWDVIWDLKSIDRFSAMVKSSSVVNDEDPAIGVVRRCEDQKGNSWTEEVIDVDEGKSFMLLFNADDPDFPMPVSEMRGGWFLNPEDGGCDVSVWWEFKLKARFMGPVLVPLFALGMDRDFVDVVTNMAAEVTGNRASSIEGIRLLPRIC
ncbi:SRPBCC family protein [Marinobacter sp. CHS3-4]|uniref:SRPBCC family protein n=1 Tax=Marinobacter sp. CHS3-4 TaxID=3045174 RepID=UPI0024B4952C|nr:SRPBCC family protein [Marinobacter sp. CHS3-4]MDI9245362.1 SRPBCC family protein [Marinobacter sp. CHS3-4]